MNKKSTFEKTKTLMAALGRMPPKQHKDMKLGNRTEKVVKSPRRSGVSAKPKSA